MPRKKTSTATATATATTPASRKLHKRQLSSPATITPGSRTSKRLKTTPASTNATVKKSKYFEGSDEEDVEPTSEEEDASESGYEDVDADEDADPSATEASPSASESEEEDYDSEADTKKRNKKRAPGRKSNTSVVGQAIEGAKDLWREGVKAGLGPGKQVFIAKPKPRGDGGVKYVPERIHPNTMAFLADLKKNNDREWLKMHDPDYRQAWNDWTRFVEVLTGSIGEVDETVPELPPKDLVFRIYRDVRFSNDPTPYKPHFSAAWSRTGRKGPYACYYLQIQPGGKSFVGAGLWHPEAAPLALLRRNIDRRPEQIKGVLSEQGLRREILGVNANDEKKAVKAFAASNAENALKTRPKGYEADNPNIELLKLKNFTIGKKLKDDEIADLDVLGTISTVITTMVPFVTYLNSVVMPEDDDDDDNDDSSSSSDESDNNASGSGEDNEG